jgi:hypothetical protein
MIQGREIIYLALFLFLERTSWPEHDVMPNETGRVIAFHALEDAHTRFPDCLLLKILLTKKWF